MIWLQFCLINNIFEVFEKFQTKKRKILENDQSSGKRLKEDEISNVAGEKAKENPSFWIPQLNPTAEVKIEKPASFILQEKEYLEERAKSLSLLEKR